MLGLPPPLHQLASRRIWMRKGGETGEERDWSGFQMNLNRRVLQSWAIFTLSRYVLRTLRIDPGTEYVSYTT
jgi:hypothetical protein